MKKLLPILLCLMSAAGCKTQTCTDTQQNPQETACIKPIPARGNVYENWAPKKGWMHQILNGSLTFDVGSINGAKYLERSSISTWVAPELITAETAEKDKLSWASNRYVRWLGSTTGTLHFPLFPDEWEGDLFIETGLRPKMNPSMAIRFYKPDGNGGRTWSEPLTTDLTPGYHGYRWKIPREYLVKDGMQLMRVSFPGSYFEGENRVAAKFVHFSISAGDQKTGIFELKPTQDIPETWRVLDQKLEGYGLRNRDRMERFFIPPQNGSLEFYTAPGSWMDAPGNILVTIQNESEKKEALQIHVQPGECWKHQHIDLSEYGDEAIRVIFSYVPDNPEELFSLSEEFRPDVYISSPEIVIADDSLIKAGEDFIGAKRIVILAIDNLRADRLWNDTKRRAVSNLGRLADDGILGLLMGEGKNFVAMETSFLTGVPATDHKVYESGTFVRSSLDTIGEAASEKGWKSWFYTTSSIIDTTHGFAQGFDEIRALNKENITKTDAALAETAAAIKKSSQNSLFYVHLSELRLPHRASDEVFSQFAVPGYAGPVNEDAMNNIAVMHDPSKQDAEQFEAYYDAELYEIDDAVGKFVSELDSDSVVIVFGTHGNSLGESTLGYEQGMTPWELITPFILYRPDHKYGIRRQGIANAADLSASVREIMGAQIPEGRQSIFTLHNSRPTADSDGMTAASSMKYFYRIKRDGVFSLFSTGLDGSPAQKIESSHPLIEQALREQIE